MGSMGVFKSFAETGCGDKEVVRAGVTYGDCRAAVKLIDDLEKQLRSLRAVVVRLKSEQRRDAGDGQAALDEANNQARVSEMALKLACDKHKEIGRPIYWRHQARMKRLGITEQDITETTYPLPEG